MAREPRAKAAAVQVSDVEAAHKPFSAMGSAHETFFVCIRLLRTQEKELECYKLCVLYQF